MQDRSDEQLGRDIRAGGEVEGLIPIIEAKIELHKRALLDGMIGLKADDDAGRKNIHLALQVADVVLQYLTSDVKKGKEARRYIEDIRKNGRPKFLERILP